MAKKNDFSVFNFSINIHDLSSYIQIWKTSIFWFWISMIYFAVQMAIGFWVMYIFRKKSTNVDSERLSFIAILSSLTINKPSPDHFKVDITTIDHL